MKDYLQTVTGPVAREDMGLTLPHEHLFNDLSSVVDAPCYPFSQQLVDKKVTAEIQWALKHDPYCCADNMDRKPIEDVIFEINNFISLGGRTIVDATGSESIGRDAQALREVALKTGLNIVASSGPYLEKFESQRIHKTVDELATTIDKELNQGIGDTDIRAGMIGEIGVSPTFTEEELNDYFRSGKRKEQQMLEEEDAEQRRSQSGLWGKISQWSGINNQGREDYRKRDFAPDSPEIKFSDRREALELMTQIESTVTSLHREAEAQFRPELEKIVSGIETGFRGTALYATENIAGRINARLEDEGFTVKISFPAVSQLQTRLAVKINLSALMEERTETVTRRRRQSGVWGTVCRWFGTSDLGWENYDEDVSRSVININKVREEVMSLTRAYFGELQASIEQDINQPVRQEIDAFFCAFREKVEQLRNTLIQSSEDHKRDQQAQERLTGRLQALNERVPELITDSKALREELETML
ncbi:hypothetical protein F7W12_21480 [Escherichia coli]|uniref:phosphotriesterase family protein n=1 Tax=Escherichia coli TaxID=562 RepID=UPI000BDF2656|nr:hypothetical protein [Escherichia coli]EFE7707942.1 hypothetical protein [Escherichia coli]EFH7750239.1 hypothetical protein [Escherichia coli]HAH9737927.1 hypothetical protein [Escherichia coli]HAW8002843.1 hypothetical protein [Escherichia coli]